MTYKKEICALVFGAMMLVPTGAMANCYADYKAKQVGTDLRLHYGVIALQDRICADQQAVERDITLRIGADNWTLLRVLSKFDQAGLSSRKQDAGDYFLKY